MNKAKFIGKILSFMLVVCMMVVILPANQTAKTNAPAVSSAFEVTTNASKITSDISVQSTDESSYVLLFLAIGITLGAIELAICKRTTNMR